MALVRTIAAMPVIGVLTVVFAAILILASLVVYVLMPDTRKTSRILED